LNEFKREQRKLKKHKSGNTLKLCLPLVRACVCVYVSLTRCACVENQSKAEDNKLAELLAARSPQPSTRSQQSTVHSSTQDHTLMQQ